MNAPGDPGLACLLNPRSVAVIGASDDPLRIGGRPIAYMRSQGFAGDILPVNPGRTTVQQLPAYASVAALAQAPEVAIIAVAAQASVQVVADLAQRGTRAAILFSAGYAESGPQGAALQDQLLTAARAHGMRILGPNALGIVNPRNGFFGSFVSSVELGMPQPGRVAIISQSGAYGGHLLAAATSAGIGLSACAMTGNEADITLGEVVQLMVDDADTDVIALYSEGLRDADKLVAALAAARRARKPVVMMKVGRSVAGQAAAQSHTASLAGNDAVIDAVLAELGVVRARSTEHLLDVARLATRRIYPVNNALGVITVSGGAGVIACDAAEELGLPVPQMPEAAQADLKALLPYASPRNPVDVTAQFLNDFSLLEQFTETLIEQGGYPSVLGFFTYTASAPSVAPRLRQALQRVRERHPDRLFVLSVLADDATQRSYEDDGFCVFEDPGRAVQAIDAMGRYGRAFDAAARESDADCAAKAEALAVHALLPACTPSEAEAKRLLAAAGVAGAPERICTNAYEAVQAAQALGYPVVLKILSPDIVHKTEIGGVLLNIADDDAVRQGFATLIERASQAAPQARLDGVLVAKQLSGGVECIVGVHRDPVFGPIAMFGLGGIFVETLNDVVLRRCPFGVDQAEQMIRSIKGAAILLGTRDRPPVDIRALAQMLSQLSVFAAAAGPRLQAIDLNPVLAMPEGQGAFALDAVIEVLPEVSP